MIFGLSVQGLPPVISLWNIVLSTLSFKSFNLLLTIILYLLLTVSLLNKTLRSYSLGGGGEECVETFCVGGITWVSGGTEEFTGGDCRKVTSN